MNHCRRKQVAHREPLLAFLMASLGLKRKAAKSQLKFGAVSVNGAVVRQFDHRLAPGDEVVVQNAKTTVAEGRLEFARIKVLFEDEALIVLDKPAGLLCVATANDKTDTLFVRLNEYLRDRDSADRPRALVVHRLDRETSGLVVFAKTKDAQRRLQESWAAVEKVYLAIVHGRPEHEQGTIAGYLTEAKSLEVFHNDHQTPGGRLAITHYRLLQTRGKYSLLEVRLETGRKHQIRVHLAEIGCPVAGDRRYGSKADPCHRMALHASTLSFAHPLSGAPLAFESPLPGALRRVFPRLRNQSRPEQEATHPSASALEPQDFVDGQWRK